MEREPEESREIQNRRYKKINTEREKVIKRERAGASEGGGEEDGGG